MRNVASVLASSDCAISCRGATSVAPEVVALMTRSSTKSRA